MWKKPTVRATVLTAMAVLVASVPSLASAQIPEGVEGPYRPSKVAEGAISQIESPWCPGLMLEVCPAEESRALRDSIHGLALEGWTEEELVRWVLDNHGERYLAVPQRGGVGLWAWLMPPAALLFGVGVVITFLRRARPPKAPEPVDPDEDLLSPEEEEFLQEALRQADEAEE